MFTNCTGQDLWIMSSNAALEKWDKLLFSYMLAVKQHEKWSKITNLWHHRGLWCFYWILICLKSLVKKHESLIQSKYLNEEIEETCCFCKAIFHAVINTASFALLQPPNTHKYNISEHMHTHTRHSQTEISTNRAPPAWRGQISY